MFWLTLVSLKEMMSWRQRNWVMQKDRLRWKQTAVCLELMLKNSDDIAKLDRKNQKRQFSCAQNEEGISEVNKT